MFTNDYSTIAHKKIIDALAIHQDEFVVGYGCDKYCKNASSLIKKEFGIKNSDVYFLTGGTQTNLIAISYFLKNYEGVMCVDTGHINVHETAAVEGSGHKIILVPSIDGKVDSSKLEEVLSNYQDEHMVKPRMLYISNTTEIGTIYTKYELLDLRKICDKHNLILYMDGARLGVALTSSFCDYDAKFIGKVCDMFYIGGTKNGLLYGEALVISNKLKHDDFRYHIKNKGALNSKGFILGIQFETLFKDNLFYEIGKKANDYATQIIKAINNNMFYYPPISNQLFIKVSNDKASYLMNKYGVELWKKENSLSIIRIVTSYANSLEEINNLVKDI